MSKKAPILLNFITEIPFDLSGIQDEGAFYDPARQLCTDESGEVVWSLGRKPYTNCYTAGRVRPAGYNKNNKYVPRKFIPGKSDRRSGK